MAPAVAMLRPRPVMVRREASHSAPSSAPAPVAVMSKPSVCAPPPRISAANTGISTVYGTPTRQTRPTSPMTDRIGSMYLLKFGMGGLQPLFPNLDLSRVIGDATRMPIASAVLTLFLVGSFG